MIKIPTVKTIKDVEEEAWLEFKSIAASSNVKMGKLFTRMVEGYKANGKDFWDDILKGPHVLNKEESEAMLKTVRGIRKEYGFRSIK